MKHFGDEAAAQRRVLSGLSEGVERNDVSHPLDLMDDSVSVGQVGPVGHSGQAVLSDHSVDLCLNFLWKTG